MRIAFFSTKSYDKEYFDRVNSNGHHQFIYFEAALNSATASLSKEHDAVCLFVNDKADRETVEQLSANKVKLIALRCAGFNNVDLEAASKKNIKVVRVPAYSPEAVAEHAVALILTLNRKTHKAYNRIREGNFSLENLTGFNLHGKTVGVIGTGKIGQAFCRIMLGFGCKILAYDKFPSSEMQQAGVSYQPLDEVFAQSDIISLHCPLLPETHHLINEQAFSKMKKGVMLINTSRGAVINTADAIDALKNEKLGYFGIDVYEQEEKLFFRDLSEKIIADDMIARLIGFPNVLITSHQGFFTKEALEQIAAVTIKNINDFEQDSPLENEISYQPEVQKSESHITAN
ncbi:MAG TPA: 2-hydroxyacid dehydrogenase [Chitinophagaceae bacterium]|nr:2-hydroxyacid dehydrogenase [Chitinophagaceae bacterium]